MDLTASSAFTVVSPTTVGVKTHALTQNQVQLGHGGHGSAGAAAALAVCGLAAAGAKRQGRRGKTAPVMVGCSTESQWLELP